MEKKKTQKKAISGNPGSGKSNFQISPEIWRVIGEEIQKEFGKVSRKHTPRSLIIKRDTFTGNNGEVIPRVVIEINLMGKEKAEGNLMDIIYRKGDME